MKSSAARSMPNDRRRVAPPPPPPPPQPVFFPYPMLPYNHPYAYTPPPVSWSFVRPQPPIPSWDNLTYVYTQTLPSLSSFVSPPPPPTPPSLPFWNNTQTLHPPSFPTPTPAPPFPLAYTTPPLMHPPSFPTPTPSAPPLPLRPPSNSFPPKKEEDLSHKILKQIEYYFCDNNLAKDLHLKDQMDIDNGWVSIEIKEMTDDIKLILDSLKHSDTIEVEV
ncbi:extensin-like [Salvia miltiorrhiza]|uniref:extensin-like n=1 Tax=Salvia miltiorrhiza TaxID=226208 RepID=UPI0025ACA5AF|nr:extensin-like [Salvia miltiorrhiza]